jgi:regulator of replication initiation timing
LKLNEKLARSKLKTKIELNLVEEAEVLKISLKEMREKRHALQIEERDLKKKEKKAARDNRHRNKKAENMPSCSTSSSGSSSLDISFGFDVYLMTSARDSDNTLIISDDESSSSSGQADTIQLIPETPVLSEEDEHVPNVVDDKPVAPSCAVPQTPASGVPDNDGKPRLVGIDKSMQELYGKYQAEK